VIETFSSETELYALGLSVEETRESKRYTFYSESIELIDLNLGMEFKATVLEEA
jgi:hypothetical protein